MKLFFSQESEAVASKRTQGPPHVEIADFIAKWSRSGGSEQANAQPFLMELCAVLGVETPQVATEVNEENVYAFERKVFIPRGDGTSEMRRLDLYKRGCFVLEAKQGKDVATPALLALPMPGLTHSSAVKRGSRAWEDAMARAKRQAESYVRALPAEEGRPPFILAVDVGFCFDLFAEFSRTGGMYIPFPDARTSRVFLKDLVRPEVQGFLRAVWEDPLSLDPSRHAAKVTQEIAKLLAELARSLEADGHDPEAVAAFLIRCLFCMFAEDVSLIPPGGFHDILERSAADPRLFQPLVQDLWKAMNDGSVSVALGQQLRRFNGKLFANPVALPLTGPQIAILREASAYEWSLVEPAIFGTLLERALVPGERQMLGAHYTPRAYVERLVLPTVITPLRQDWHGVQAAASLLTAQGKSGEALQTILDFHRQLCAVHVLDPACGSGNFLYVTLEHMKRLEGEVLTEAATYGQFQPPLEGKGLTVNPQQFLGLEKNPRAAHIAEMVLWIGYLQWHYRTHGSTPPPEPILRNYANIEHRDAVLVWDSWAYAVGPDGKPLMRWDGKTMKRDPVTGRDVPDEAALVPDMVFHNPRPAEWPQADFIVGNPPFIGAKFIRAILGNGYFAALNESYPELSEFTDFVMYWWHKAASLVRNGQARRFGFITTNSLPLVFNRRVTTLHLTADPPLSLAFAIPDHPWVDSADGAAVRIAMTVGMPGVAAGVLAKVVAEESTNGPEQHIVLAEQVGRINSDLTVGVNVAQAVPLRSNEGIIGFGMALHGSGFIVTPEEATALGLGRIPGLDAHIRPYRNGKDITGNPRGKMVIDLFGLTAEEVRDRFPEVYQRVFERVKPGRDHNNRASIRELWWVFGWPRPQLRAAKASLSRFIVTPETAKHRFFVFLEQQFVPDHMLVCIASADAYHLGVLSSRVHVAWALAAGGRLGVGNDPRYNNTVCFAPFPFPDPTPEQKARIRELGERLDAHRKARQGLHPELTLTGMYNVLEALREGRDLTPRERDIHDKGLVGLLRQIHDELDAAVAGAYGWPADLGNEDILARLVELNAQRTAEEEQGLVRWLRPEYQAPRAAAPRQARLELPGKPAPKAGKVRKAARERLPWPPALAEQMQAVRLILATQGAPTTAEDVALRFRNAPRAKINDMLQTLAQLGFARIIKEGMYLAA